MTRRSRHLTDRFFLVLGFVQFVGLIAVFYPFALSIYLGLLGGFFFLAVVDYRTLRDHRDFTAALSAPLTPEIGENLQLGVEVLDRGKKASGVSHLTLVAPRSRRLRFARQRTSLTPVVASSGLRFFGTLAAKGTTLGYEELSTLTLTARSRFWIWFIRMQLEIEPVRFRVIPTKRRISEEAFAEMKANQQLFYQGSRQIIRGRSADQFHSIRKYQFPDPIRHIDPKKTAKYNQLMTRVHDSIYHHHLVMALDLGRPMCGTLTGSNKCDFYLAACLALAENALSSRDHVSFTAFSQRSHYLIDRARGMKHFEPLLTGHRSLSPSEVESNYLLLNETVSRIAGQRSIVLILTDPTKPSVQQALLGVLPALCRKHLVCVVGLVDENFDLDHTVLTYPTLNGTKEEYAGLLYAYWLQEQVNIFRRQVARLGGGVLVVSQGNWLSVVSQLYRLLRTSVAM